LDAARDASAAGFRAIVVKSHHHSMQPEVLALGPLGLEQLPIKVFGGVALNRTVGGLNPYAVELALRLGGRIVWFPTLSSPAHVAHQAEGGGFPVSGIQLRDHEALSILDPQGKVKPVVHDIIDLIIQEQAILNCGHLPAAEVDVLVPAAVAAGVERIVVSHPHFIVNADAERAAGWARQGAYIEHCLAFLVSSAAPGDLSDFAPYLKAVGVQGTIFSSDLGQKTNPLPLTGYRRLVRLLLDAGYTPEEVTTMISTNPGNLLLHPGNGNGAP
jgi:hypothetical protein